MSDFRYVFFTSRSAIRRCPGTGGCLSWTVDMVDSTWFAAVDVVVLLGLNSLMSFCCLGMVNRCGISMKSVSCAYFGFWCSCGDWVERMS